MRSRLVALFVIASVVLAPTIAGAGEEVQVPDDRVRVSFVEGILDEDGQLWFKVGFYVPWDATPPSDLFSAFWGLFFQVGDATTQVGWEVHDGEMRYLGDPGTQAFILDDGSVLVGTGLFPTGDFSVSVQAQFASWEDEATTDSVSGSESMGTSAEFIDTGDPFSAFGGSPVYDLASGEMVTPTTTSSTTTTQVTSQTTAGTPADDGPTAIVLDDGGGLSPMWWILILILVLGLLYWLLVYVLRWWRPPWSGGDRYAYRVGGSMYDVVEEDPDEPAGTPPPAGGDATAPADETKTEAKDEDDTDTETLTGTDAPVDTDEDDEAGGAVPPPVFEDRRPTPQDCQRLRLACEDLKEEAAKAREEAERTRKLLEVAEAECDAARQRISDLEAKVADLEEREDAPQRYQRLVEAQNALRDAQAGLDEICHQGVGARQILYEHNAAMARKAQEAADEACRKAEECEQQIGQ